MISTNIKAPSSTTSTSPAFNHIPSDSNSFFAHLAQNLMLQAHDRESSNSPSEKELLQKWQVNFSSASIPSGWAAMILDMNEGAQRRCSAEAM